MSQMPRDIRASFVLPRQITTAESPVSRPLTMINSPEARDVEVRYVYPDPTMALDTHPSPYFQSYSLPTSSPSSFMAMTGNEEVQINHRDPPTQSSQATPSSPKSDAAPPQDATTRTFTEHEDLNPQRIRCTRCRKSRRADQFPILTRGPDKGQRAKTCEFCKTSGSDYNERRKKSWHTAVEEARKG